MTSNPSNKVAPNSETAPKKDEQDSETVHVIDPNGDVTLVPRKCGSVTKIQVSSPHLTLASPVFKAMLRGNFAEGKALAERGAIELMLPDDDGEAMLILMNIIHGKFFSVPKAITRYLLGEIAVLVDKYQLHEAVHSSAATWISSENSNWTSPATELRSNTDYYKFCLDVSLVFSNEKIFRWATRELILHARTPQIQSRLPVCPAVFKEINARREGLISSILREVGRMKSTYDFTNVVKCTEECDMMVLGAFSMALNKLHRLAYGDTFGKFKEMSVNDLFEAVKNLRIPSLHVTAEGDDRPFKRVKTEYLAPVPKCGAPKDKLVEAVTKIVNGETGLDVRSYKKVRTTSQTQTFPNR